MTSCCHPDSSVRPSDYAGVKNSQIITIMIIHKPELVLENGTHEIRWDLEIQLISQSRLEG